MIQAESVSGFFSLATAGRSRRPRWWAQVAVAAVVGLLATAMALVAVAGPSQAQVGCSTAMTVTDADGLDNAIECYNASTDPAAHIITFGADITHPSSMRLIIGQAGAGDLTIDGADHTLTGPGDDGMAPVVDLITAFSPNTEITITNLTVTNADSAGISIAGGSVVTVSNSTLQNNFYGILLGNATGEGTVTVVNSSIEGNEVGGISASVGSVVTVSDSSIHSNGSVGARVVDDSVLSISNSTIYNNDGPGVAVLRASATVANATIYNNAGTGLWAFDGSAITVSNSTSYGNSAGVDSTEESGVTVANSTIQDTIFVSEGSMSVGSSIVTGNCFAGIAPQDLGNNFGAASCGFTALSDGSLAAVAAPNGCAVPCTNTVALLAGSNAIGAGDCSGYSTASPPAPAVTIDQRGETRGTPCDAGAFETSEAVGLALTCVGRAVTVDLGLGQVPTQGSDVILGTPGDDVIKGLGGDDWICGLDGNDTLDGGFGADRLFGGLGNDLLIGGPGNDEIQGRNGNDRLLGGKGKDKLFGNEGKDLLKGGSGNDKLDGGIGKDKCNGGKGNDTKARCP